MSFQNFETFQNQHGAADSAAAGTGAPATADSAMAGQSDPSPAPFQGPASGEASSGSAQQGGDAKTTLWYVIEFDLRISHYCRAMSMPRVIRSLLNVS